MIGRYSRAPREPRAIEAIIFDCDGTLVDSERVGNAVLVECIQELGLCVTLEEALEHFAGRKMADTLALIEQWLGHAVPDGFLPMLRTRMASAFEAKLDPMDGVHRLLEALAIPACVASNGPQEKMEVSLRVTGLLNYFPGRIYSAYDCGSWKPDPGLFLHAARNLGVAPTACAVVEDSPLGIQAAVAAKMVAFGYAPHGDGEILAAAGARVFHHMDALMELLPCIPRCEETNPAFDPGFTGGQNTAGSHLRLRSSARIPFAD